MKRFVLALFAVGLAGCGGGREMTRAIEPGFRSESWTWTRISHQEERLHPDVVLSSWASDPEGVYCPVAGLPHWAATVKTHAYSPWGPEETWIGGSVLEKWVLDINLTWYGSGPPHGRALITWGWDLEQWGEVIPEVGSGYVMMGMFRGLGGMSSERRVWPGDQFFPGEIIRRKWEDGFQQERELTASDERLTLAVGTESWVRSRGLQDSASGLNSYNYTPNRLTVGVTIYPE